MPPVPFAVARRLPARPVPPLPNTPRHHCPLPWCIGFPPTLPTPYHQPLSLAPARTVVAGLRGRCPVRSAQAGRPPGGLHADPYVVASREGFGRKGKLGTPLG